MLLNYMVLFYFTGRHFRRNSQGSAGRIRLCYFGVIDVILFLSSLSFFTVLFVGVALLSLYLLLINILLS